jgi:Leucine-rich repeat (LRR) protein
MTPSSPARRWLPQFSLRTALALLTIACLWMGIVAPRARDQRLAVARIESLGGSVLYDYQWDPPAKPVSNPQRPGPAWLRRVIGDGYFERVSKVTLDKTAVSDVDMQVIGRLRGVEILQLNDTNISDAGLREIRSWKGLRYLGLMHSQITSAGLNHLKGLQQLNDLIIPETQVDDAGLTAIAQLKRLDTLNLDGTRITSQSLSQVSHLPLTILGLQHTLVDDRGVADLGRMKSLMWLLVTGTPISGEGLLKLHDALPECQLEAEWVELSSFRTEGELPGGAWQRTLARLQALNDENRLKFLDLSGTAIRDRHLADLAKLIKLQMLDLRRTEVSDEGVASLQVQLPDCKMAR